MLSIIKIFFIIKGEFMGLKKISKLILIILILIPSFGFSKAEKNGSIFGKITYGNSSRGVPDIKIEISNIEATYIKKYVITDKIGRFVCDNLKPGTYELFFSVDHPYYYFDWLNGKNKIEVKPGKKSIKNIKLKLGGAINGKLYNIDGKKPLSDIPMTVENGDSSVICYTNEDGSFSFGGVPRSEGYKIKIGSPHFLILPDEITVIKGKTTWVKDIFIDPREITKIHVSVRSNYDNKSIPNIDVSLRKELLNGEYTSTEKRSDKNGDVIFDCLEPGEYSYSACPFVPYKNRVTGEKIFPNSDLSRFIRRGKINIKNGDQKFIIILLKIPSDMMGYKTDIEVRLKIGENLDKKPSKILFRGLEDGTLMAYSQSIIEGQMNYRIEGIPPGKYSVELGFIDNGEYNYSSRVFHFQESDEILIPWDEKVIIDVIISGECVDQKEKRYNERFQISTDLLEIIKNRKENTVYYKLEMLRKWYK